MTTLKSSHFSIEDVFHFSKCSLHPQSVSSVRVCNSLPDSANESAKPCLNHSAVCQKFLEMNQKFFSTVVQSSLTPEFLVPQLQKPQTFCPLVTFAAWWLYHCCCPPLGQVAALTGTNKPLTTKPTQTSCQQHHVGCMQNSSKWWNGGLHGQGPPLDVPNLGRKID